MAEWYWEFRERDNLVLNSFRNFKPVKRFQNGSDVLEFRWDLLCSAYVSALVSNFCTLVNLVCLYVNANVNLYSTLLHSASNSVYIF